MRQRIQVGAAVMLTVLLSATAVGVTTTQAGAANTRGFDGKTITIGGMWSTSNFSGAQIGAQGYMAPTTQIHTHRPASRAS